MPLPDLPGVIDRLREFQKACRDALVASRRSIDLASDPANASTRDATGYSAGDSASNSTGDLHEVERSSAADTIYRIDALVEPIIDDFCRDWAKSTPLVLIAEGVENEHGEEGIKVYPEGSRDEDAKIRLLIDPIDGTRGLMYDKRSAWALAAVAPNKGPGTRLRDIEAAAMTELPTSKMGRADVLWAAKGSGTRGVRVDLSTGAEQPLRIGPSRAAGLHHGFASVVNFFPGTKALAAATMERIAARLIGAADVRKAAVFDDQYICTGGQFYELIVGHDRFIADLRPVFYKLQNQPEGLCCHPYDCAALLIAEEAGVIITDESGRPLDGPMDTTSGISWAGYANAKLRESIEPVLMEMLKGTDDVH